MSLSFDGAASRASRRSRTMRSCCSVSASCSRKIRWSSGSLARSGAACICGRACSSIEWASVRYLVSCSSRFMPCDYPGPQRRIVGGMTARAALFDIDGTLISSGGAGGLAWREAFQELYGVPADIGKFSDAGMTDPEVGRLTFEAVVGHAPSPDELGRVLMARQRHLPRAVAESEGYRVLPGVRERLDQPPPRRPPPRPPH